jgi:hypothetical protein
MRTLILAAIAAACLFMLEGQASAKIAFVRATIVEASVIVIDGKPDFTSGHIVVIRETDDKKERVVVKITPRTLVTQSNEMQRRELPMSAKDLKVNMRIELVMGGERVGDTRWEAHSIRVLGFADPYIPRPVK